MSLPPWDLPSPILWLGGFPLPCRFGCKNAGFVEAVELRGAELHRDTFCLEEDRIVFTDGSSFQCDAIVACTGTYIQDLGLGLGLGSDSMITSGRSTLPTSSSRYVRAKQSVSAPLCGAERVRG